MRRQKAAALAAGLVLAGLALGAPATTSAAVFITDTNCAGCEGIHFDPDPLAGDNIAFGSTEAFRNLPLGR